MSNSKQLVRLIFGQPEPIEDCIPPNDDDAESEYDKRVKGINFKYARETAVFLTQNTWYALLYNRPDLGSREVSMSMHNFLRAARVILGPELTVVSSAIKSELFEYDRPKVVPPTNPFKVEKNRKRQRDDSDSKETKQDGEPVVKKPKLDADNEGKQGKADDTAPLRFSITFAQLQSQRLDQEDRVVDMTCKSHDGHTWRIWGVLDGHGGARVVNTLLQCWLPALPDLFHVRGWKMCAERLEQVFLEIDKELCSDVYEYESGGTTVALVFLIDDQEMFVVHLGDSRVVFLDDQFRVLWATEDHRGSNPDEFKRIKAKGGSVNGVYTCAPSYSLGMSRTIGDRNMKCSFAAEDEKCTEWGSVQRPYTGTDGLVVARASVARFARSDLSKPELRLAHVVAATDGVWDALAGYGELPHQWDERLDIQDRIDAHRKSEKPLWSRSRSRTPSPPRKDVVLEKVKAPTREEIAASEERRTTAWMEKLRNKIAQVRQKQLDELTRLLQLWHRRPEPEPASLLVESKIEGEADGGTRKTDVQCLPSRLVAHCEAPCSCKPSECYHADNKTVVLGSLPTKSPWGTWY